MTDRRRRVCRRDFILGAAAASATPMLIPRHVLGGSDHTPPSEKVNVAGIGVGNRGWQVIQMMESHNIVALCDVDAKYLTLKKMEFKYEEQQDKRQIKNHSA